MHGELAGYYESRKSGRLPTGRGANFRLFCVLERSAPGLPAPALVVITGLWKPLRAGFRPQDYAAVRLLGDEYFSSVPKRGADQSPGDLAASLVQQRLLRSHSEVWLPFGRASSQSSPPRDAPRGERQLAQRSPRSVQHRVQLFRRVRQESREHVAVGFQS